MGKKIEMLVYASSLCGLLASGYVAVCGILSFPLPLSGFPELASMVTLLALFPIGALFMFCFNRATYDMSQREIDAFQFAGCPGWMRHSAVALMAVGVALFFLPLILGVIGYLPKNDGTSFPSTMPGGFGIVAYTGFFVQLFSVSRPKSKPAISDSPS